MDTGKTEGKNRAFRTETEDKREFSLSISIACFWGGTKFMLTFESAN